MNKQSNIYTLVYTIVLVVVVGAALAWCATALRPRQLDNENADKMKQILLSVHRSEPDVQSTKALYESTITGIVVNASGEIVEGENAFDVNVAEQVKVKDVAKRLLPLYIYRATPDTEPKYIIPMYGAGLWGPIWGYISLNSNAETVYGAYFSHQGETPGLGAEIEKEGFTDQFNDKLTIFEGDRFYPIEVVKSGLAQPDDAHRVNGISGGTITSKGVGAMLDNCLAPYETYLSTIRNENNGR